MVDVRTASKTLAAVYVRVSTDKQEKWSPDAQRRVLLEHCARQGWEPVLYGETGSGETIEGRPQMMQLLQDARARKFAVCLVVELSRLSRDKDLLDMLVIKQTFRQAGVRIATPSQTYDLARPEDDFTSDLLSIVSKHEKQRMLERVKRGMNEAKRQGKYLGEWLPYGWKAEGGKVIHDPAAAEGMRLILSLATTTSSRRIVEALNARGIPTKKGNRWRWSALCRFLQNPALCGKMTYGALDVVIPPYLTEAEFQDVQEAYAKRRTSPTYVRRHEYLLTGMLFCGKCGSRVYAKTEVKKGVPYGYYLCARRMHETACTLPSIRREGIEGATWDHFATYIKSPQVIYDALSIAYEEQDQNRAEKAQEEAQVARRLADLTREETKMVRAFYGDRTGLSPESFQAATQEIRHEKGILEKRLQEIKATTLPTVEELAALPSLQEARQALGASIDAWTLAMKREAMGLLLDRVTVREDMTLSMRFKVAIPLSENPSPGASRVVRVFEVQTLPIQRISRKARGAA